MAATGYSTGRGCSNVVGLCSPAHFHAVYGEHEALMTFDGKVYAGSLPGRALSMVREWLALHRDELEADWTLAFARKPLKPIEPLE